MDARKCDRCGNLYELKLFPQMFGSGERRSECLSIFQRNKFRDKKKEKEYDLCPDCAKAVRMWLKNNRKSQPTNMVQEGEWQLSDNGGVRCSLCLCNTFKGLDGSPILSSYCTNCGAWMKGVHE